MASSSLHILVVVLCWVQNSIPLMSRDRERENDGIPRQQTKRDEIDEAQHNSQLAVERVTSQNGTLVTRPGKHGKGDGDRNVDTNLWVKRSTTD